MEISVYEGDAEEVIPVTRGDLMDLCATAYVDGACSIDDESRENVEASACHMVDTDHESEDSIRCDVCQKKFNRPCEPFKFCPNCGRKVIY